MRSDCSVGEIYSVASESSDNQRNKKVRTGEATTGALGVQYPESRNPPHRRHLTSNLIPMYHLSILTCLLSGSLQQLCSTVYTSTAGGSYLLNGAYTSGNSLVAEANLLGSVTSDSDALFPNTPGATKVFNTTGGYLGGISNDVAFGVRTNVYLGNYYALVVGLNNALPVFKITVSGATVSLAQYATYSSTTAHSKNLMHAAFLTGANYVYLMDGGTIVYKYDFTVKAWSGQTSYTGLNNQQSIRTYLGTYLIVHSNADFVVIVKMSDMSTVNNIGMTGGSKFGMEDNIFTGTYYLAGHYTPSNLYKTVMSTQGSTFSASAIYNTGLTTKIANLINFGNLQFVGAGVEATTTLLIVSKQSMTLALSYSLAKNDRFHSMITYYQVNLTVYFSVLTDIGSYNYLHVYNCNFDYPCTLRNSSSVCLTCAAGFYRNSLNPNNLCISPPNFPAGYGVDAAHQLMALCQTGCLACLANYTWCTLANNPSYILNTTDGTVYPNSSAPVCLVSNCVDCTGDVSKCFKCATGYYLQYGFNNACYTNTVSGWGLDQYNNSCIKQCSDSNCAQCLPDYSHCQSCSSGYAFDPISQSCILKSQIPLGYGLDAAQKTIAPCTVPDCKI